MDKDTEYVYDAIINYEPTYLVLQAVAKEWMADQDGPIAPYRDRLQEAVEQAHFGNDALGLVTTDLDDVSYAAMIEFEAS